MARDVAPPAIQPPGRTVLILAAALGVACALYGVWSFYDRQVYGANFFFMLFGPGFIVGISSLRQPVLNALIILVLALVLSVLTLREGVVCVLMSLPLILPVCMVGVFLGHILRRYLHARKARIAAAGLVVIAQFGWQALEAKLDDPAQHPWHEVSNTTIVQATPAAIFKTLVAEELQLAGPWPAVLQLGLPTPRRMQVEKPGLGGVVRFDFNHGAAWGEIVAWQEAREFAFEMRRYDIQDPLFFRTRLSGDEHFALKTERVTDWLSFGRLAYHIEALADGRAQLTRVTRFQRHIFPSFYFGWLQETVVRAGGQRLVEQVRDHAERAINVSKTAGEKGTL